MSASSAASLPDALESSEESDDDGPAPGGGAPPLLRALFFFCLGERKRVRCLPRGSDPPPGGCPPQEAFPTLSFLGEGERDSLPASFLGRGNGG